MSRFEGCLYQDAGHQAPLEVQSAIMRYRSLPLHVRCQTPLLYWLLGSGTPPYKMSKADSAYQTKPSGSQKCGNCRFAWQSVTKRQQYICSQIDGEIKPQAWCRLWRGPR